MSLLISDAWADAAPAAPQDAGLMGFLPLIVIFVLFYFLLIRPQMKRAKEHRKMVETLSKNDEVVTSGGLLGKIVDVEDRRRGASQGAKNRCYLTSAERDCQELKPLSR